VTYKSELSNGSPRRQVQIPKLEGGKRLDISIIDDWFLTNERMKRGSVHIIYHTD